ncbi:DUF732 domain-containing protein [Mycobacterium bourgelatii]|nr:DUF732 domain-containing protein [Mycobacterium bourgelatii]MCV6974163.1 DUF732 domain-containing protein [Mycobacterium bourgelatii]
MGVPVALGASLAMCAAVALSAPARADQNDFISQLDSMGVRYESISDVIDIGRALCHDLRDGVTPPPLLARLKSTGFAPAESAIILLSAIDNMCPDTKDDVVAWARSNGYTGPG